MKHYTEHDYLSCTELKAMPVGSHITGTDTYYSAYKVDEDEWLFDDRIEARNTSSYFVANVFTDTEFDLHIAEED